MYVSPAKKKSIQRAPGNLTVIENPSMVGIGYTRAEDRDDIPQAAELLKKEENIHTAIVFGIVRNDDQDETLTGSSRTSKLTLDPDEFLKTVSGTNADSHFYGGGKLMAGSFSEPINQPFHGINKP
jgi:nanoRNase/pAp phosphatase (c-di-AMP/oligoRNAs hydrolase)